MSLRFISARRSRCLRRPPAGELAFAAAWRRLSRVFRCVARPKAHVASAAADFERSASLSLLPGRNRTLAPAPPLPRSWWVSQGMSSPTSGALVRRPDFDLLTSRCWPLPFSSDPMTGR